MLHVVQSLSTDVKTLILRLQWLERFLTPHEVPCMVQKATRLHMSSIDFLKPGIPTVLNTPYLKSMQNDAQSKHHKKPKRVLCYTPWRSRYQSCAFVWSWSIGVLSEPAFICLNLPLARSCFPDAWSRSYVPWILCIWQKWAIAILCEQWTKSEEVLRTSCLNHTGDEVPRKSAFASSLLREYFQQLAALTVTILPGIPELQRASILSPDAFGRTPGQSFAFGFWSTPPPGSLLRELFPTEWV